MPAPGQIDPTSLASRVRLWFSTHPGEHRAAEVADGIGAATPRDRQEVASICGRLVAAGHLHRRSEEVEGRKRPVVRFTTTPPATAQRAS